MESQVIDLALFAVRQPGYKETFNSIELLEAEGSITLERFKEIANKRIPPLKPKTKLQEAIDAIRARKSSDYLRLGSKANVSGSPRGIPISNDVRGVGYTPRARSYSMLPTVRIQSEGST